MKLSTGSRWQSQACSTAVIVVRIANSSDDVDLRCGGHAMAAFADEVEPAAINADFAKGSPIGKRYELEDIGLEVLVTRAGDGSLSVGGTLLVEKAARRLPSSD